MPATSKRASKVLGVIPARFASSRFPGIPLADIAGKPLVQHVWERCRACKALDGVVVATDDRRIFQAAREFGADVEMTRKNHPSGTDRIAEVARRHSACTHFINVQGDEPLVSPRLLGRLARALKTDPSLEMVTAANVVTDPADLENPNIVKVVLNKRREALYFSRSRVPFARKTLRGFTYDRHQGIYGFSRDFLLRFVRWKPTPLEQTEQLEQLRALENGAAIRVLVTSDDSFGVDTPEQARLASRMILKSKGSRKSKRHTSKNP